jgi:hypothetical protein
MAIMLKNNWTICANDITIKKGDKKQTKRQKHSILSEKSDSLFHD